MNIVKIDNPFSSLILFLHQNSCLQSTFPFQLVQKVIFFGNLDTGVAAYSDTLRTSSKCHCKRL